MVDAAELSRDGRLVEKTKRKLPNRVSLDHVYPILVYGKRINRRRIKKDRLVEAQEANLASQLESWAHASRISPSAATTVSSVDAKTTIWVLHHDEWTALGPFSKPIAIGTVQRILTLGNFYLFDSSEWGISVDDVSSFSEVYITKLRNGLWGQLSLRNIMT